jgi:predicted GNAT superfamily acetyltransferase
MKLEIRLPKNPNEYRDIVTLEQTIWQIESGVDAETMMAIGKNGGVVLLAYDLEGDATRPIGFALSFLGLNAENKLKHHSHMAGVLAAYRDKQVGYALKLAQRDLVLKQGITHMTWTCDPLESRNANFNFSKLGTVCNTYYPNLYGDMSGINEGSPSDRFQVDWFLDSARVVERLQGVKPLVVREGVAVIASKDNRPPEKWALDAKRIWLEIPTNFQTIKVSDRELALAWRMATRDIFTRAFAKGYTVTDFIFEEGRGYYLLET